MQTHFEITQDICFQEMQQLLGLWPRLSLLWYSCELSLDSEALSSALSPACAKGESGLARLPALLLGSHRTAKCLWLLPVEKRTRDSLVSVLSWEDLFSDGQTVLATLA